MPAYATPSDMITRYDVRVIAELATDDDVPLSRADVLVDDNVAKQLLRASGDVDVALIAGKRYTPTQLGELSENSEEHLKDIVCRLAMGKLFDRRPGVHTEMAEAIQKQGREDLKLLASGVNVFGLTDDDSHLDAGLIKADGPTTLQINDRNFLAARLAGHHIPSVDQSQPRNKRQP